MNDLMGAEVILAYDECGCRLGASEGESREGRLGALGAAHDDHTTAGMQAKP